MAVIATMKAKINHLSPYQHLGVIVTVHLLLSLPGLWVPYFNIDELTNALYARFINAGMVGLKDFLGSTYLLTHYLYALVYSFTEKQSSVNRCGDYSLELCKGSYHSRKRICPG